jgi:hypothetical protein
MVSLNLPVAIFSWSWTNVLRVSIATWLQNKDYFEFERALVQPCGQQRHRRRYSHGHATDLKRQLLEEWADNIEKIIQPSAGVAVLR